MKWKKLIQLTAYIEEVAAFSDKELGDSDKTETYVDRVTAVTEGMELYLPAQENWNQLSRQLLEGMGHTRREALEKWLYHYRKDMSMLLIKTCLEEKGDFSMEPEESQLLCPFLLETDLDPEFKAMAVYNIAIAQKGTAPMITYVYGMKAFLALPELAKRMKKDYVFRPELLNESYQERCPVCGCGESDPHYCAEQFAALTEEIGNYFAPLKLWLKCRQCKTLYAYNFPVLSMERINGHYTEKSPEESIQPGMSLSICGDIMNRIRQFTSGRRYLEVGVGRGEMLATALEMGYNVKAVEICREDGARLSQHLGIEIACCDFLDYTPSSKVDVIVMGNVLEHMSNPVEGLEKACSLLEEDGILWLSTPNYNSGHTRLMKWRDPMWNQRNHFTFFSYESLEPLLTRIGFKVVRYDVNAEYKGAMDLFCMKVGNSSIIK